MAWRDAKASSLRLFLFIASIILGIAAVVSIQLFSENLKDNIKLQSKSLMGADYIIDSEQIPSERAQAIIDSLGPDAFEVNFVSMISFCCILFWSNCKDLNLVFTLEARGIINKNQERIFLLFSVQIFLLKRISR